MLKGLFWGHQKSLKKPFLTNILSRHMYKPDFFQVQELWSYGPRNEVLLTTV